MKSFEVMDYEDQELFLAELSEQRGSEFAEEFISKLQAGELFSVKNIGIAGGALGLVLGRTVIEQLLQKALLSVGAKVGGQRLAGAVIPGLNVLLGAWTLYEIAGPAFRKTVPTVIEVAMLRLGLPAGQEACQQVGDAE